MGINRSGTKRFYFSILVIVLAVIIAVGYFLSDGKYSRLHTVTRLEEEAVLESGQLFQTDLVFDDSVSQINAITVYFNTFGRVNVGQLDVTVYEDSAVVQEFSYNSYDIGIDGALKLKQEDVLTIDPESHYSLSCNYVYSGNNAVAIQRAEASGIESSRLQRACISIIVLALGAAIAFCISENNLTDSLTNTKLIPVSLPLLLLYSFFFQHGDGYTITKWGVQFLDCMFSGDLRHYADVMLEANGIQYTSNYDILNNFITAVSILPVYLVKRITGFNYGAYNMLIFDEFRKLVLILAVMITSKYINKIVISLGGSVRAANTASLLYLLSPVLLYCNIGMGQIDCFCVLFMALFFNSYINDKKCYAMLFLSIAILIKSFPLLFVLIPLVCISINKRRIPKLNMLSCLLVPWIISWILSTVIFIDYSKISSLSERTWGHAGMLFNVTWAHSSLFMTVFVVLCFVLLFSNKAREADSKKLLLISSCVVIIDLTFFVEENPQWFIYALFIMLITIPLCHGIYKPVACVICYSLAGLVYSFSAFYTQVDLNMVYQSILGNYFDFGIRTSYMSVFNHLMPNLAPYMPQASKTVMAGMVLLSLYWFYESKKSKQDVVTEDQGALIPWCIKGLMIFDVAFVLVTVVLFFGVIVI
ncbi:MAG: hypothetical protein ILA15_07040 [Clostridiales bacterium]|nr:hypothetical protein [Clostridiales bacterium]